MINTANIAGNIASNIASNTVASNNAGNTARYGCPFRKQVLIDLSHNL